MRPRGPRRVFEASPTFLAGEVTLSIQEGAVLAVIGGPEKGRIQYESEEDGWWWQLETQFGDGGWIWRERFQECATE